jgi:hypothetical protein
VAGTQRATGRSGDAKILHDTLIITEYRDLKSPNRCQFTAKGFTPSDGDRVVITLGGADNPERLFLGTVVIDERTYVGSPDNAEVPVQCVDNTRLLNQRKVTKRYTAQAADVIVLDLMSTYAASFTTVGVHTGLDTIDEITFTNQDVADCVQQVANRIGAVVYLAPSGTYGDLHFFTGDESLPSAFEPTALTTTHDSLHDFSLITDGSQVATRVLVEGGGANAASEVSVGETILPVSDAAWYDESGGTVQSGPQRITYTGVDDGGAGSLVGPGAAPSTGPAAALASGSGVESGAHGYAVTFVTGFGESIAGPTTSITVGTVSAPTSAPTAGSPTSGGSVTAGAHYYAVTNVTAAGETTPSPVSGTVTAVVALTDPGSSELPTPTNSSTVTGALVTAQRYFWKLAFRRLSDLAVTAPSPSVMLVADATNRSARFELSGTNTPSGCERVYSRTEGVDAFTVFTDAGLVYKEVSGTISGGYFYDTTAEAGRGDTITASNNTALQTVGLSGIPVPSSALVTSKNLYRTAAGGAQLKLLASIATAATTYSDTIADGSLGANVPVSNTATANQVSLASIALGPSGTTSRKIYRTVAAGSQLKLLTTLADNTTQTLTDSTADASLGANVPTSDTSGLAQPSGQVIPGATSIPVANWGDSATAGWAVIGNGQQVIRYTGVTTGNTLTGIPSSGNGAITATIAYNSTITTSPQLTGVPASGDGSVLYIIARGEPVNVLVTVNDTTAQTAMANRLGASFGIHEAFIQDRRLSIAEATARGRAYLDLRANQERIIRWRSRDKNTRAGRVVTATLAAFNLSDDFKIQQVTITNFVPSIFPTFTATASNSRYSLEELLREIKAA